MHYLPVVPRKQKLTFTVSASLPVDVVEKLLEAADLLKTTRSRAVAMALAEGLPIVLAAAQAVDQRQLIKE